MNDQPETNATGAANESAAGGVPVFSVVLLWIILFVSWLLWSGIYKPLVVGLGAFSCCIAVFIAYRVDFFKGHVALNAIPRLPRYWGWLLIEIFKSSIDVARIVLTPKMPISPTVLDIEAESIGPVGQAILGNAITLSPGTVTLDVHEGRLRVHCLTQKGADDLAKGEFKRRSAALDAD